VRRATQLSRDSASVEQASERRERMGLDLRVQGPTQYGYPPFCSLLATDLCLRFVPPMARQMADFWWPSRRPQPRGQGPQGPEHRPAPHGQRVIVT
jgi:hypothetical protein